MSKTAIHFKGGRSERYLAPDATPTGRRPYPPRWSPPAAAATVSVLKELAGKAEDDWVPFFLEAAQDSLRWKSLMAKLEKALTQIQFANASSILRDNRAAILELPKAERSQKARYVLRSCRRRAADCPTLPSLGIPKAAAVTPASFLDLIATAPKLPVRATPSAERAEGPLEYVRRWDLGRVQHQGAVVFSRAGGRVREWLKRHDDASEAEIELSLANALVHKDILPTLTANKQDQPWLTGPQRYMSVHEVCRCMGLRDRSPITRALASMRYPANAVQLLGKAVHAGVASLIVSMLEQEGLLPVYLTYASACSGIDTFAEALDVARPGGMFLYAHAAESDGAALDVLQRIWALPRARMYRDAADTADAPCVHLYMLTPDCHDFSKRRHGRDAEIVAQGAVEASYVSPFLAAGRATVAVVENVDERDGVGHLTTLVAAFPAYSWRSQRLAADEHAGFPTSRERRFWVGVRHDAVRRAFPVHG